MVYFFRDVVRFTTIKHLIYFFISPQSQVAQYNPMIKVPAFSSFWERPLSCVERDKND